MVVSVVLLLLAISSSLAIDPDATRNVTELILSKGYPCEDHIAETQDGWLLSLQRIPYGRDDTNETTSSKPVVFLLHGFMDESSTWVINFPEESLGFILADAGYDVWLGNNRGNAYSLHNTNFQPYQQEFWNFSYDEMARYDIPAMHDYVLQATNTKTLTHVGHSQGNLQAFAAFSINATVAARVNLFIALAPVVYFSHQRSLLVSLLSGLPPADVEDVIGTMGLPPDTPAFHIIDRLIPGFCKDVGWVCDSVIFEIVGCNVDGRCDPGNLNLSRTDVYSAHIGGSSVQDFMHLLQASESVAVPYFNYGSAQANQQHYNQGTPPTYDIKNVDVPVALFIGEKDNLGDPTDCEILQQNLPKPPIYVHVQPNYTHLDPIWGMDAHETIYPTILELIANAYST